MHPRPPLLSPDYRSTRLRAPRRDRIQLPRVSTELTGPALWDGRLGEHDHDLTCRARSMITLAAFAIAQRVLEEG